MIFVSERKLLVWRIRNIQAGEITLPALLYNGIYNHQNEGVMQLVNRKIHRQTGHTGGFSIWGLGN